MTDLHAGLDDLPLDAVPAVDRVCDAFEAAWRAGGRPRIEEFAGDGADALLCELVCVDVEYRQAAGDPPTAAEYRDRFPGLDPDWLDRLLAAPARETPKADGKRLGRFALLGEIGRGATGTVWRAHDPRLNRVVALKVPHPGTVGSAEAVERFRREGRTAAALRHPGIVAVHDVAVIDGDPVLVQDFLDGESVRTRLSAGRLSAAVAAGLVAQVADALDYAHRAGAVHRDIKPANVVLTHDGRAVLVDFGLALQDGGTLTLTADGQVVGTPAYMSPEQAAGHAHAVDPRTDVYSLGVVLYEMLAGRPPFQEARAAQLLRRVIEDEPDPPRRWVADVPRDLETVCLTAMAKEPGRRYATAGAFAADLRRFLAGEPVTARPLGVVERATRWVRRHPYPAGLAGACVVAAAALVGLSVAWAYNARLDRANRTLEEVRADEAAQHRETETAYYFQRLALASREWQAGNTGLVRQLLADCPSDLRGWEWQYLDGLTRRDLRTVNHFSAGDPSRQLSDIAYSPDGTLLATASQDGTIRVWVEATGQPAGEFRMGDWGALSVAWHPDGRRLAAGDVFGRVVVWDRAAAVVRELTLSPRAAYRVAFSPDGRRLAAGGGDGTWEVSDRSRRGGVVRVWEVESGREELALAGFAQAVTGLAFHPDGDRLATAEGAITTQGAVGRPGRLAVWDAATGGQRFAATGHEGPLTAVAYSPDGRTLATAGWDRSVVLWDAEEGRPTGTLTGHRDWVRSVAFAPDGKTLASGGADATIAVWAADTGRLVRRVRGHTQAVAGLAFHPSGTRLASAGADKTIKVWNPRADQEARVLAGAGPVTAVAFTPDGTTVLSAGYTAAGGADPQPTLTAWNPADGSVRWHAAGHTDRILCLGVAADGRTAATAGRDRTVRVWNLTGSAGPSSKVVLADHPSLVRGVALAPGGMIAAASLFPLGGHTNRDDLLLLDPAGDLPRRRTSGLAGSFNGVAYSPDGGLLAAATNGGVVVLWDETTGQEVARLGGHTRMVSCVQFSRDGRLVASSSEDNSARVWDVAAARGGHVAPLATLRGHARAVTAVAFGADGSRLATGSADGTVKLWDVRLGQEVLTLTGHTGDVTGVAFSPDGRSLASSSTDGSVRLWEAYR